MMDSKPTPKPIKKRPAYRPSTFGVAAHRMPPIVYEMHATMMDNLLPSNSLSGDRKIQPPMAPTGISALTSDCSCEVSDKEGTRDTLAPEMSDWSTPESMPPNDAKHASMRTICFFSLNWNV
ncbi:hypothetical protein OGATHE_000475 [Ogataea polymorpha]|uniref:Uncharacterized protein n=1 Tax=Ogataea polymorpha TaxID=460523 RepID=A0A9P8TGC1_9ASCO|nr:hypothetical protein OGATHE_000475 [Ogataea polymorpha]